MHYKTESEKAEAILSFSKCTLSIPEIEQLVIPMRADYLVGQVYKKESFKMKQKQEQQMKINLDRDCVSPPKSLIDAYEKESATDIWKDRDLKPEYRNNLRIHAASKGLGNKISKKIFYLMRRRFANSKEYHIFHISISTKDHWGNNLSIPLELGFVDLPVITRTYAFNPHSKRTTGSAEDMGPKASEPSIDGFETTYTYPWEQVKEQILSMEEGWDHS